MAIPKNQKNSKYWDLRSEAEKAWIIQNIQNDEEFNAKLKEYYDRAILSINRTIEAELARLAIKENVDINEIKQRVKDFDVQEYSIEAKRVVDEADKLRSEGHEVTYDDFSKEINERLRLYNATMRINRQELLKSLIGLKLIELGANVDASLRQKLTKDYTDEITRQAGILGEFKHPIWTGKEVAKIVMAQTGSANFSKRIWANQDALKARLDASLSVALIQGQNPRKMAQQLRDLVSKEVTNARYATERIARTESARVQTQAQLKSFRDYGYKFCKWHAEPSACKICKEIAENDSGYGVGVYRVDEVPSLPAHPNCRCGLGAYWVDEKVTIARAPYGNKSFNDMLDSINGISEKDIKEIKRILSQAPEDIQKMFHKYARFVKWITFDNNDTSGFYYLTKRINFVPDQFMGKNEDYKKYDIFFHEFAHAIDYFYGNHKYFSKNSKIRSALFNDYENLRDSTTLKESIAATQRLLGENKFSELYMDKTNQKSKILLSLNSRKLTLARDELGNFTSDQIDIMKDIKLMEIVRKGRNVNWVTQMNVSDIINGASNGEINPGYGHPIEYWTKHKMQAVEFFAETTSAMINNPESLLQIKKMFPNAYKEYLKVVEDIANG